ncbi:hypothetical protein MAR_009354 [Mya arenaria]|uniref:Uncharacterized protein n=1 Tax=Mya arenaria TaxID=6604 RepID=A0ABY7E1G4_MYAAR|nr:hypothetical protein MAR_009354 [Mya arenaria]
MSVNLTLIQATDVNMSIDALVRGLRTPVSLTAGVGRASWFGQGFTHHHKTQLVFLEYSRGRGHGLTAQCNVDQVLQPISPIPYCPSRYCPTQQRPAPCCKADLRLPGGQQCPNVAMAGIIARYEPNRTRLGQIRAQNVYNIHHVTPLPRNGANFRLDSCTDLISLEKYLQADWQGEITDQRVVFTSPTVGKLMLGRVEINSTTLMHATFQRVAHGLEDELHQFKVDKLIEVQMTNIDDPLFLNVLKLRNQKREQLIEDHMHNDEEPLFLHILKLKNEKMSPYEAHLPQ